MQERGQFKALLKRWQAPPPRTGFEGAVIRRLHAQAEKASLWRRWVVEPLDQFALVWRREAMAVAGVATVALLLAIGFAQRPYGGPAADLSLDSFITFSKGSVTSAYMDLVRQ